MSDCQSECDCGNPSVKYCGPHDPDCHWWDKCEDGKWCDKHLAEAEKAHRQEYERQTSHYRQDMIDAGRGHLLPDVLADQIDYARMREKDSK